jgi:hypothetical protein
MKVFKARHVRSWRLPTLFSGRTRWVLATAVVAAALVLVPMLWPNAGQPGQGTAADLGAAAKLTTTKKIYSAFEQPVLHLAAPETPPIGWIFPGIGRAFADGAVTTTVRYNDKYDIDVPVAVKAAGSNSYDLALKPKGAIKPGRYVVTAKWGTGQNEHTATQSFAWGVLAVNTVQSEYTPGQTVQVQMGVLSSSGNTICDAPLTLSVTAPNGDSYVEVPDYTASYTPTELGKYIVTARLSDSDYQLSTSFQVVQDLPYQVVRTGPSRLYPYSSYQMKLQITPASDFTGQVVERLPGSFTVTEKGSANVTTARGYTTLTWDVGLHTGVTQDLVYSFRAPLVSPAFYEIQPLSIQSGGKQAYQESRKWQIASDAVITFVKETPNSYTSNATSNNLTITSTTGNCLILIIHYAVNNSTTPQTLAVSDTATNTWVVPPNSATQNPPYNWQGAAFNGYAMAYALNASAVTQITIAQTSSIKVDVDVIEFSNVATSSAVDQSASTGHTTNTTHATPTLTTTNADDLLIGGMSSSANTFTISASSNPTSGWNALFAGPTPAASALLGIYYQIVSSTGSYQITQTVGSTVTAGLGIMAFKNQASGGCSPVTDDLMRGGNYFCSGAESGFFWAT